MAAILSDQEVQQLIQIVEGGVKERRRHWYTLGIPINHHYSLDEQLGTIRMMGESKNVQALNYLNEIAHAENVSEGWRDSGAVYSHDTYLYSKAPRSLQHVLEHECWDGFDYTAGSAQPVHREHPQRGRVMSILSEAITRLQKETS